MKSKISSESPEINDKVNSQDLNQFIHVSSLQKSSNGGSSSVHRDLIDLFNQQNHIGNSKQQIAETTCFTGHTSSSMHLDSSSCMASVAGNHGGFTAALFITPPKVD